MHHVFLSYSRNDAVWLDRLEAELSALGVATWIDRRDLPVNLPWLDQIRDAVEEASLFVLCESEASLASAPCAAERAVAEELAKPASRISVRTEPSEAASAIHREHLLLAPELTALTELRVRARNWERARRPAGLLLGGPSRIRLARAERRFGPPTPAAKAYLVASRRRAVRRTVLPVLAVGLAVGGAATALALVKAKDQKAADNALAIRRVAQANAEVLAAANDPYVGLRLAADRGKDESAISAEIVTTALGPPVPVDAFDVEADGGAERFATTPIDDDVVVLAGDGSAWQRAADALDVRAASPRPGGSPEPEPEPKPSAAGLVVTTSPTSAMVAIERDGTLLRRLSPSAPPTATATSPDGRYVAVGVLTGVEVFDVGSGSRRLWARGAPGSISDLAWSRAGDRLWAVSDGRVVGWDVGQGSVLVDDPDVLLRALLPAGSPDRAWVVQREGVLGLVDTTTGATVEEIDLDDTIYSAAADGDGRSALVVGKAGVVLVDLGDGTVRPIELDDCTVPEQAAFAADGATVAVPCGAGGLVWLDATDGSEVRRIAVPDEAVAVGIDAGTGDAYVVDGRATVHRLDGDALELLREAACRPDVNGLAVGPNRTGLLPYGFDQGGIGCTYVASPDGGSWRWNALIELVPDSIASFAATYAAGGDAYLVGHEDGTVLVRPADNFDPARRLTMVGTSIRGLLPLEGTDDVLVASRDGLVTRITVDEPSLSNRAMAAQAADRLARAEELGLA